MFVGRTCSKARQFSPRYLFVSQNFSFRIITHCITASSLAGIIVLAFWTNGKAWVWLGRWSSHSATYTIDVSIPVDFYTAINAGANTWTNSTASTWKWTNDTPASGNKVKYVSIDGPGDTAAEVSPYPFLLITNFELRLDNEENWYFGTGTPGGMQYDVQSIATHEFGHALGLGHTQENRCPTNTPTNPTMCEYFQIGSTYWRTLESDDTAGLQYNYPPLVQLFWRGTQSHTRQTPIINGSPNFNQAQSWTSPQPGGNNPGAGDVQAWANVVYGTATNQTLYQEVWQSNTRWRRTVPVNGGIPSWSTATNWISGLGDFGTQPGDPGTDTQASNSYILCDKLYQGYWRGDKGYSRKVQLVNGVPDWNHSNTTAWVGPVTLASLGSGSGSGSLQALSIYRFDNTQLRQGIWRSNVGYSRLVPIDTNCAPDWNIAGAWGTGVLINTLPGSGDMRAQDNYAFLQ